MSFVGKFGSSCSFDLILTRNDGTESVFVDMFRKLAASEDISNSCQIKLGMPQDYNNHFVIIQIKQVCDHRVS